MSTDKCDHCGQEITRFYDPVKEICWCRHCIETCYDAIIAAGIVQEHIPFFDDNEPLNSAGRWVSPSNIEKMKSIPKKVIDQPLTLRPIAGFEMINLPEPASLCKKEYYGIECSCGCRKSKRESYNNNIFGY